ncbi:hypothetical protein [Mycobacterium sp. IS-1264]|uniref:hypothetical protein n=1 Tax=Mycobacterium sp. IS-1264 TaxID=1834158 RepID=UPI00096ECA8D|nr:hypothetical protein [Mycobacterium sp. IS-1264]OMC42374.1 hypothetical protein A5744_15810 [Mycobacterium sp. IS-1264]
MQFLASALPGFRDLRAPLIAGYLWLFFGWILIKPDIHKRPNNVAAAAVYDLAKDAGPIWIGLGVGVAAYLIGSVSQALSPVIGHKALPKIAKAIAEIADGVWDRVPKPGNKPRRKWTVPIAEFDLMQQYLAEAERRVGGAYATPRMKVPNPEYLRVLEYAEAISRRLNAELDLPATLLLTERGREPDPQLFSEADRLKAERELRLAVVPPLCALAIFLGWNQSSWWWFALIPVAVLLWQAHSRSLAFRSVMFSALERGLARSSSIDEFKRWVEALPEKPASASEQQADADDPDDGGRNDGAK